MATAELLLTIEEFLRLSPNGKCRELIRGQVVEMNPPKPRHGFVCMRLGAILLNFVDANRLGRVGGAEAGVITKRDPDSLRGADVCYYSFGRIGDDPGTSYFNVAPDLVCEVMSEYDRWNEVLVKVAEYLAAGVTAVCVLDPDHETVSIFRSDREPQVLGADDILTLPDVLPGFSVPVYQCFV